MMTTDYLVNLNRYAIGRFGDHDYAHVGQWGSAGEEYDDDHALLMVRPGCEADAEEILDTDPGVIAYALWDERACLRVS
jgi:hypothetical protein